MKSKKISFIALLSIFILAFSAIIPSYNNVVYADETQQTGNQTTTQTISIQETLNLTAIGNTAMLTATIGSTSGSEGGGTDEPTPTETEYEIKITKKDAQEGDTTLNCGK